MKREFKKPSDKEKKKLVDLIYMDENVLEGDLKKTYWARINTWIEWINAKLDEVTSDQIYIEEQSEYFMVNNLLRNFLIRRLEWVLNSVPDNELRNKYLLALPPFNQAGKVKHFLLHFFQFKDGVKQEKLSFQFLNYSEKEVRILWDIYKLTRTLETIDILKKAASGAAPFPSTFKRKYIIDLLKTLSAAISLLLKICVKQEHHKAIAGEFPHDCFSAESILMRKESNDFLINDVILERFDYRNYFFHIFFRSSMKAKYKGEDLTFKFNYLDFEIIRQEFLIDWLNRKLANNPKKNEVLDGYLIGRKTFREVIEKTPEVELTILKRLPKHVFDDLIADVNLHIGEGYQTPIDPMSETSGEFSRQFMLFEKAKGLAKKSISAIRKYITLSRKKKGDNNYFEGKEFVIGNDNGDPTALPMPSSDYKIKILKKSEIDFPFFCVTNSLFSKQMALLQSKMSPSDFTSFDRKTSDFLSRVSESALVKRRTPRHEWALPYLIQETINNKVSNHLLILGAEVKNKQMGMGYGAGNEEDFELKSYFVYGTAKEQTGMGSSIESRTVRGKQFFIYPFTDPVVVEKVMKLIGVVINK